MMYNFHSQKPNDLVQIADRLAHYALRIFSEYNTDKVKAHKKAIMVVHMAGQMLLSMYPGKEPLNRIIHEAAQLLELFTGPKGDA